MPEAAESTEDEGAPAHGRAMSTTQMLAVGAAVCAVAAVVLLLLLLSARRDSQARSQELSVRTTAARFVEAFVALDTSGPVPGTDAVIRQLGTGTLVSQHDQAMAALRKVYAASGAVSARGEVKNTYIAQLDGGSNEASVIVVANLVITGQGPQMPFEHYLEVHAVKLGGKWRVDNVTDVNTQLAAAATGSTTTAPPTTTGGG